MLSLELVVSEMCDAVQRPVTVFVNEDFCKLDEFFKNAGVREVQTIVVISHTEPPPEDWDFWFHPSQCFSLLPCHDLKLTIHVLHSNDMQNFNKNLDACVKNLHDDTSSPDEWHVVFSKEKKA